MKHDHWLVRAETIRKLWIAFIATLVLVVLADLFVDRKAHFGIDGVFSFGAWFGFAACVVLVVGANLLGALFKRRDDYYDEASQ